MTFAIRLSSREEFLEWIGNQSHSLLRKRSSFTSIPRRIEKGEVILVWQDGPEEIVSRSPLIFVERSDLREFYAFVHTYVSTFNPLTAFFRVLSIEREKDFRKELETLVSRESYKWRLSDSIVGVAIAEASAQIGSRAGSIGDISIQACLATASSSVIAAMLQGYDADEVEKVSVAWARARRLVADDSLKLPLETVAKFWRTVAAASKIEGSLSFYYSGNVADAIVATIKGFIDEQKIQEGPWEAATRQLPDLRHALVRMGGTREDRVRVFDECLRVIHAASHVDLHVREFAVGTLMALLAGGSFEYLTTFTRSFEDVFPGAVLWFGLFTSLHEQSDALISGNCLGRRIARDLCRRQSLFSAPKNDIGVDELEFIGGIRSRDLGIRTEHQTIISVEIAAGISGRYRVTRKKDPEVSVNTRPIERELLGEVQVSLYRAMDALNRMGDLRQEDLFVDRSIKSKSRPKSPRRS